MLLANTSPFAGQARVTVLYEGGGTDERNFPVAANSRFNVDVGLGSPPPTAAASRRWSRACGADPAELVVEWSLYGTPAARPWELGANALAMNLSSPLRTLTDLAVCRAARRLPIDTFRGHRRRAPADLLGDQLGAGAGDGDHRRRDRTAQLTPTTGTGTTTITVRRDRPAGPTPSTRFVLTVIPGRAITSRRRRSLRGAGCSPPSPTSNGDGRARARRHPERQRHRSSRRICARIGLGPIVDCFPACDNRENHPVDVERRRAARLVTWTYRR